MSIMSMYNQYLSQDMSDCVFVQNNVSEAQCSERCFDSTTTLHIYPISNNFVAMVPLIQCIITKESIIDQDGQQKFYFDHNSTIKLIIIILPQFVQFMIQYEINGEFYDVYEQSVSVDSSEVQIKFVGEALITTNQLDGLANYPQITQNQTNTISGVEFTFLYAQLISNINIPQHLLQKIGYKQLLDLIFDTVMVLREYLINIDYEQLLYYIQYMSKTLVFKPHFMLLLKYAVLSSDKFIIADSVKEFLLSYTYETSGIDKLINECILQIIGQLFVLPVKQMPKSDITTLDIMNDQLLISKQTNQFEQLFLKACQPGVQENMIILIEYLFTMQPEIADQYLKLIMNFNPKPFMRLVKNEFRFQQIELNFLMQNFNHFPSNLQKTIVTAAYRNRKQICFQLFKKFTTSFPIFNYFQLKKVEYSTFVNSDFYIKNILRQNKEQIIIENDTDSELQKINLETINELQYNEAEDQDNVEGNETCPICLGNGQQVTFNCSHKICVQCFSKMDDNKECCMCRQIIFSVYGCGCSIYI
ncbi:Conserved_hypothetical protein [Hexamita inflata]|uniref:RING-type domain-containing protein n=1 Tax=Hexamita inflata TaxID=28002 RepID=A0AA86QFL3_9EUKA|nr:Conserved hypothetical protein [Hexamita inflata]